MEKLKLHELPHLNESKIYFQSVSTNESENILFANAYGETEEQALERAKLIACAPEMLEMLKDMVDEYSTDDNRLIEYSTINEARLLIKKATTL